MCSGGAAVAILDRGAREQVLAELNSRDEADSTRADSPLVCDETYLAVDTSERSADEVVGVRMRDELPVQIRSVGEDGRLILGAPGAAAPIVLDLDLLRVADALSFDLDAGLDPGESLGSDARTPGQRGEHRDVPLLREGHVEHRVVAFRLPGERVEAGAVEHDRPKVAPVDGGVKADDAVRRPR
jgi:hypothetical protein